MMDKTVVIWDSVDADIKFFVVDRDLSHLDRKYVNDADNSEEIDDEISNLMYNADGHMCIEITNNFPVEAVRQGAKVIVCGFLP